MADHDERAWIAGRKQPDAESFGRSVQALLEQTNGERWQNLLTPAEIASAILGLQQRAAQEGARWCWVSGRRPDVLSARATVALVLLLDREIRVKGYVWHEGVRGLHTYNGRHFVLDESSSATTVCEFGSVPAFCARARRSVAEEWARSVTGPPAS